MSFSVSLKKLPVLGICGHSGVGKTTLLEFLIPAFRKIGIKSIVVKHNTRNVQVDTPGKDSDRIFKAGSDVVLVGEEHFYRFHDAPSPDLFFSRLCKRYDLVLVEGHRATEVPKIWLHGPGRHIFLQDQDMVLAEFYRDRDTFETIFQWINNWLRLQVNQFPVWGCVLIGGQSRRMGRPKHLLPQDNVTWLESLVSKLKTKVAQIVISGQGELPGRLCDLPRIPDSPGLDGPMAGILTAMRWQPAASWLVLACDLPDMKSEALDWLLDCRNPGVRAVLPSLGLQGHVEPLLAYYDFRVRMLLEEFAVRGQWSLNNLVGNSGIVSPCPPVPLHSCWRNVNTPDELHI